MILVSKTLRNIYIFLLISIFNATFADVKYTGSGLVIKSPYAIENRPGTKNAVMFILNIKNKSNNDIKLKGITTSVAEFSEIHSMENHGGVMKMRKISHILVPKKEAISLNKGNKNGYHIMLLNLNRDLKEGEKFNATLSFEKMKQLEVKVEVKKYMSSDH